MACPQGNQVAEKEAEKRRKYQQLCYKLRTQNDRWKVEIVPKVIGCFSNVDRLDNSSRKIINANRVEWVLSEMQRVIVTMSKGIIREIKSNLIVNWQSF